jgi:hypothetical protein
MVKEYQYLWNTNEVLNGFNWLDELGMSGQSYCNNYRDYQFSNGKATALMEATFRTEVGSSSDSGLAAYATCRENVV